MTMNYPNMKYTKTLTIGAILAAACCATLAQQPAGRGGPPPGPGLTLTTTGFEDGGIVPNKYSQADPNPVSPPLQWSHVPAGTVSFVLLMHDPDTALQKKLGDVTHWMAFNIPGTATSLPEGVPATAQLPDGTIQIKNLRGNVGFMGSGAGAAGPYHHYTWELFALDTKLDLGPDATRAEVLQAMDGHIIGKGVLVGRFHR
jgi:Raf kinase inhibitor-like YbhB/YbcL family protein